MSCPVGCGRAVKLGHLMCGSCWSSVPDHLQRRVNRTWLELRRARRKHGSGSDEAGEATLAYDQARTEAIGAVP